MANNGGIKSEGVFGYSNMALNERILSLAIWTYFGYFFGWLRAVYTKY